MSAMSNPAILSTFEIVCSRIDDIARERKTADIEKKINKIKAFETAFSKNPAAINVKMNIKSNE